MAFKFTVVTGGTLSNSTLGRGTFKKSDLSPSCKASMEEQESTSNTYEMTSKFSSTSGSSSVAESETKVDLGALQAASTSAKGSSKKSNIVIANRSADTAVLKTGKLDVISEADDDGSDQEYSYI